MREFLVLFIALTAATARPHAGFGYDYNPPILSGASQNGYVYSGNSQDLVGSGLINLRSEDSAPNYIHDSSLSLNQFSTGQFTTVQQLPQIPHEPQHPLPSQGRVTKHIYVFEAAPVPEESSKTQVVTLGEEQTHYRIIFIKAPYIKTRRTNIIATYPRNEEKTVIYVLSKEPEDQEISDINPPPLKPPSKPEIKFVTYKEDEEVEEIRKKTEAKYHANVEVQRHDAQTIPVKSSTNLSLSHSSSGTLSSLAEKPSNDYLPQKN